MKQNINIVAGLVSLGLSFCGSSFAADNPIQYEPQEKSEIIQSEGRIDCRFSFADFRDYRQNKKTLGTTFSRSVSSNGVEQWLKDALEDYTSEQYLPASSTNANEVKVQPYLTRLYTYAQGYNILGVMAFKVEFIVDGEVRETRRYRNQGSKSNWAGGLGEYHTTLNITAARTFPLLINDLANVCELAMATRAPATNQGIEVVDAKVPEVETVDTIVPETEVVAIKDSEVEVADVSGRYLSDITSTSQRTLGSRYRNLVINITQNGDVIRASDSQQEVRIKGRVEGDVIKFEIESDRSTGYYGAEGEWKRKADGTGFEGAWFAKGSFDGAEGRWNLSLME